MHWFSEHQYRCRHWNSVVSVSVFTGSVNTKVGADTATEAGSVSVISVSVNVSVALSVVSILKLHIPTYHLPI